MIKMKILYKLRALQNYQQVFDFIRRPSSLRFRKRSERHIERSGAKSKYFPVFQSPLNNQS